MSNKKLHLVFGLVLAMFVLVIGSSASAVNFKISFSEGLPVRAGYMRRNITSIHFKDNGNDFGGFIYFSNGINVDDEESEGTGDYEVKILKDTIRMTYDVFECQQRVRGFYYNAERGERLRALDDSYHMSGVVVNGGLYTRCRRKGFKAAMEGCSQEISENDRENCEKRVRNDYVDSHGYYGMVKHTYGDHEFLLAAGTNYYAEPATNQIVMGRELKPTLIRFDNKYPVGFIYDANGGLGFLGGEITDDTAEVGDILATFNDNDEDWTKLFYNSGNGVGSNIPYVNTEKGGSAMNSLISVVVDGLVGINNDPEKKGIEGNQGNEKMQYFSSVDINNMQLINYARQRAEVLCRGKWERYKSTSYATSKSLYCFDESDDGVIPAVIGKTIIVKDNDVEVEDMSDFAGGGNYDIFVDRGDLRIKEVTTDLKVFKKNGFINEDMTGGEFSAIVMPILTSETLSYTGEEVAAGKFIKGNFIVNGSIKAAGTATGFDHVYFIYGKMTTKDSVDALGQVFKWRCKGGEKGTDDTPCPGTEKNADGSIAWTNPYENASLVIIDQDYPSPLYK